MKNFILFFSFILVLSCSEYKPKAAINSLKEYNPLDFKFSKDTLYFKGEKYSGLLFKLFNNSIDTSELATYSNGLLDGASRKWYSKNQLLEKRYYELGKKNGLQVSYWPNGKKRFEFTAVDNKYEGKLEEWDQKGLLTHLANFKDGQENGVQKMWYENGNIRSNYIIKNGRRYGLLGTKNCVNVTDSIINLK